MFKSRLAIQTIAAHKTEELNDNWQFFENVNQTARKDREAYRARLTKLGFICKVFFLSIWVFIKTIKITRSWCLWKVAIMLTVAHGSRWCRHHELLALLENIVAMDPDELTTRCKTKRTTVLTILFVINMMPNNTIRQIVDCPMDVEKRYS